MTGARYTNAYRNECTWGDPSAGITSAPSSVPLTGISITGASAVEATLTATTGGAGARPSDRDAIDLRAISEIAGRSGRYRNTPTDGIPGFGTLAVNTAPLTLPSNPHTVTASGYTNLEVFIHQRNAAVGG
jgi:hypothetical protein